MYVAMLHDLPETRDFQVRTIRINNVHSIATAVRLTRVLSVSSITEEIRSLDRCRNFVRRRDSKVSLPWNLGLTAHGACSCAGSLAIFMAAHDQCDLDSLANSWQGRGHGPQSVQPAHLSARCLSPFKSLVFLVG